MPLPLLLDDSSTKTKKPLLEKALFPNSLGEPDLDMPLEFYPDPVDHDHLSLLLCYAHTKLRVEVIHAIHRLVHSLG